MKVVEWFKRVFLKKRAAEDTAPLVEAVKALAPVTEDHVLATVALVEQAEANLPGTGTGAKKSAWVRTAMMLLWTELAPHLVDLLIGVGVAYLKRKQQASSGS